MPDSPNKLFKFWQELKRRKVVKVIAMYAATAFILLEVVDIITPALLLPSWTVTLVIVLLVIGFPIAVIFSWIFDVTPEGLLRTESIKQVKKNDISLLPKRRIISVNNIAITILFLTVCILLYPKVFKKSKIETDNDADTISIDLIAVLPFSNTKSDPQTDYLGFAIADQIIGNLIYLKNITVRPSGSVRKYEKLAIDPLVAGAELEVDYILIGNYLKEANTIRLNVELVKVNTNELIWREPIEVDFISAFELQDIVAKKVVEGINVQFSQVELNRIGKDISNNPLAYEYYLRSISYPLSNEGAQLAIEMLNKSIELDSSYAPAYAQLGDHFHRLALTGLTNPEEIKKAEKSYLKALSLNKESIYALTGLAMLYAESARTEEAVELTRQVLEINPNNAEAHYSLGYIYRYAGMNNEAVQEMEKAVRQGPNNPAFRSIMMTYITANDYEKAVEAFKNFKVTPYTINFLGSALFRQGNYEQAVENFNKVLTMEPDGLNALSATCTKAFIEGNNEECLEAAHRIEEANVVDAELWYYLTGVYGLLGDRDGCVRTLKRAVEGGYFNYPLMLNDSFLDSVRDDPEFQMILQKAKEKHLAFRKRFF